MSGALDTLSPKAKELIDKFGKDLLYLDIGDLVYDPETGDITEPTETSRAFVGAIAKVKESLIDGDVFKHGDLIIMMGVDGLSWAPEQGRQVAIGSTASGEHYTIIGLEPLYTGNLLAVQKLHVRK